MALSMSPFTTMFVTARRLERSMFLQRGRGRGREGREGGKEEGGRGGRKVERGMEGEEEGGEEGRKGDGGKERERGCVWL